MTVKLASGLTARKRRIDAVIKTLTDDDLEGIGLGFPVGYALTGADIREGIDARLEELEAARQPAAAPALRPQQTRKAPAYVTQKTLNLTMEGAGKAIREFLAPLVKRIADLEARPSMQHRGVWRGDVQYQQGDVVSHGGSGWVAKAVNKAAKPGETRLWQLFVKKGRDAR
jgi:hypothetical protein